MDEVELRKYLAEHYGTYGQNRMFGPSYADQFRNASVGLKALDESGVSGDLKDKYASMFKSQQGSAVMGGALAAANGLTNILANNQSLARTNDTDWYDNRVNQLYDIGKTNYDSFDQIASDYDMLNRMRMPDITAEEVRGMNTGQKIAGVGSSVLSGAASGWQVGGLYGAIAGGLIGLGAGIEGWTSGDLDAENKVAVSKYGAVKANDVALANLGAADERHKEYKFRSSIPGVKRDGGPIRTQSITEFAESVLNKQRRNNKTHSAGFVRQRCNGGTMVRLKVK